MALDIFNHSNHFYGPTYIIYWFIDTVNKEMPEMKNE